MNIFPSQLACRDLLIFNFKHRKNFILTSNLPADYERDEKSNV